MTAKQTHSPEEVSCSYHQSETITLKCYLTVHQFGGTDFVQNR